MGPGRVEGVAPVGAAAIQPRARVFQIAYLSHSSCGLHANHATTSAPAETPIHAANAGPPARPRSGREATDSILPVGRNTQAATNKADANRTDTVRLA